MIKETIKEIKFIEYYCDICGEETTSLSCCNICKANLCYKCITYDQKEIGHSGDKYCKFCWGIGEDFREKIKDVELRAEDEIGGLESDWREKALREFEKRKDNNLCH